MILKFARTIVSFTRSMADWYRHRRRQPVPNARQTVSESSSLLGLISSIAVRGVPSTAFYPVPSCLYFESQLMTDSLAIRVATVLILVPFSVQSKICKIDSIKY